MAYTIESGGMHFEWDSSKNRANRRKHGLSFEEASVLFKGDVDCLEIYDEEHSGDDDRFLAIGPIERGVVVVVYTERLDDVIRIISARLATKLEAELFRRHLKDRHE